MQLELELANNRYKDFQNLSDLDGDKSNGIIDEVPSHAQLHVLDEGDRGSERGRNGVSKGEQEGGNERGRQGEKQTKRGRQREKETGRARERAREPESRDSFCCSSTDRSTTCAKK